ncbi:hypothetical protein F2Q69_00010333 [Brassica cretica]|uniref:Peptidase S9 prolyl oligopeptidase catalytic domain-containing protein n=1 Tax=Brassica cretica TaxID=69181 RepID=A0A8S9QIV4_BRACR|nr:hypothetical protein F2Q69_00010333 [Brassica cretica]
MNVKRPWEQKTDKFVQYPSTMLSTADHDDRVGPTSYIQVACGLSIENNSPQTNPIIARIEVKAGHGAGRPTQKITCDPKDLAENKKIGSRADSKINIMCVLDKVFENGGRWVGNISTQDNFYMLPLLTALTFWFTSKVPTTSLTKILSRIKELPLYCIFFLVFQTAFKLYYPAVYFYLITYKLSLYTLHLMCRSKQIAKLSKTLGVPYVPVTASDQERIMASAITVMREFIDVRKDKK